MRGRTGAEAQRQATGGIVAGGRKQEIGGRMQVGVGKRQRDAG